MSVSHVALSYETEDILLYIAGDKSDAIAVPCVWDSDDWLKCWMLQFYDIDMTYLHIC